MTTSAITAIQKIHSPIRVDISSADASLVSLEDRLRDAFSSSAVSTQQTYEMIKAEARNSKFISSHEGQIQLQVQMGEYQKNIETITALTKKGISAIETLLRT